MSLEDDLFSALKSLVGNRMSPNTFPLAPRIAVWPAIRFIIIDNVAEVDICGDGDDATATPRVQLDIVASTYAAVRALRLQVMARMKTFDPPAIVDGQGSEYEAETNTYRERLDFLFHGSS